MAGYIYIVTNKKEGTLYIGVTSNLAKRVYEHKQKFVDGFSKKYNLTKLIYYEQFNSIEDAIKREWKINIINQFNPNWEDLYNKIIH